MTTYQVQKTTTGHEVIGLAPEYQDRYTDTLLIFHYEHGDVATTMGNAEMMLGALYDLYQCHDGLEEGDRFETEFGTFECVSFHVVPADETTAQAVMACERKGTNDSAADLDW